MIQFDENCEELFTKQGVWITLDVTVQIRDRGLCWDFKVRVLLKKRAAGEYF